MGRLAPPRPVPANDPAAPDARGLIGRIALGALAAGLTVRFAGFPWGLISGALFLVYVGHVVVASMTRMARSLQAQKAELEKAVRELAREKDRMSTFHAFGDALAAQTEIAPLAELILRRVCDFAAAEMGTVYVAYEDGALELAASRGLNRTRLPVNVAFGDGLTGRAAEERRPVASSSQEATLTLPSLGEQRMAQHELHLPLLQGARVVGVVTVARVAAQEFAASERDAVVKLAGQAAVALSSALALAATREAAAVNRAVVENAADAVVSMDDEGVLVAWNRQAQAMFGWSESEALGTTLRDLLVPARDRGDQLDHHTRFLATRDAGSLGRRFEMRALHRDGHELPVELTIVALELENRIRFNAFIRDISERKRHERYEAAQYAVTRVLAESRTLEDALGPALAALGSELGWEMGAFWSVDDGGARLAAAAVWEGEGQDNQRFAALCRERTFEPGDGLPGRVWQSGEPIWLPDLSSVDNFERLKAALDQGFRGAVAVPVLRGPEVLGVMEFFTRETHRPDPQLLVMLETIGNQVGQFVERKRAEREAELMKDEFFALVSHELRTPLTSIIGYLELVLEEDASQDTLSAEQRRFLQVVERNARRLLRLVGDLLFVAQAQAGTLALETCDFDLGRVARECVEAARPRAEEHGVELDLLLADAPSTSGDPDRVAQTIDNLVSNAIKFTPEGGRVEVALSCEGDSAVIEVRDTGIGFSSEDAQRLFERFFRASSATERAIPGVGLGLTIAKSIVEAHGGRIEVAGKEGAGTVFRVELPLRIAAMGPALPQGALN